MAKTGLNLRVTIRLRWWVPIYFAAMRAFIICLAPFADKGEMADWIDREVQWVFRHGYRLELSDG